MNKKENPRKSHVIIRMNKVEKASLKLKALKADMTISEYIRTKVG